PQLITDFEAYNASLGYEPDPNRPPPMKTTDLRLMDMQFHNWVGDLMVECTAEFGKREGQFVLELAEAARRYQCTFDLAAGKVVLSMNGRPLANAEAASPITSAGTWTLRFANFDDRLIVWVGDTLVFGDGVQTPSVPDGENGPTEQDLKPARIG